ncbi:hypothetical protein HMPREF1212_00768 [Parabacteroides sp. HGS0025]|uniref:hypothetical protein n=1 Tax=Parabacteroides sp. HGS0025 TaxID=1078087 RepID=UPI0006174B77|nr:hypothetical protein [Parabacteroides sp. HGS0025]KKB52614.1 hypothetical protein HMPREF1212_00768 [Parabacteroides sp. HGS0025]
MKNLAKKGLVFLSALILISCQNDFDDNLDKDLSNAFQTKSSVSAPSVLSQLSGIPVNIKMKGGNLRNPFLSARPKDNKVVLHSEDDGSLRQRWLITSSGSLIKVEGGAQTNGYLTPIGDPGSYIPKLLNNIMPLGVGMEEGAIESTFYIYVKNPNYPSIYPTKEYLYSKDAVNIDLAFAEEKKTGGRHVWEIVPVENFTLKDVTYFMDYGDRVDSSLVFIRNYDMDNRTNPNPITHTFHIEETYSTTSLFSKVTGLNMSNKISNSTTFKTGLPTIDISGSVNFESLTESTWSVTTTDTESKSYSWKDDLTTIIPANTHMRWQVYMMVYKFDVSYVGTLVGNVTGRSIRLKGRWTGTMGSKFKYVGVSNSKSGNLYVEKIVENNN